MAQRSTGYLTADGKFFPRKPEADLYEAEQVLLTQLQSHFPNLQPANFIKAIDTHHEAIRRYINASGVVARAQNDRQRMQDSETLVQLPPSGAKPVSNLRPRSRRTPVRDKRPSDGS